MIISDVSTCPDCGGHLKYYDKVSRIVRTEGGSKRWVKVKRFKCVECNRLHRKLPDYIIPYKQYDGTIIRRVINGSIGPDTLGFEDYPCEATMLRWARK